MRKSLGEGLAIVVSILLAFAIDAAWEDRTERAEEHRALSSLLEEVQTNRDTLRVTVAFHRAVQASANLLLSASAGEIELSSDSVTALLGDLSWWRTTNLETGALDAVLLGDGLRVLRNEGLRRRLASWKRIVVDFSEIEDQDFVTYESVWMPFIRQHADLPRISNAITEYPGDPARLTSDQVTPVQPTNQDHADILSNPLFANVVLQKRWVQDDVLVRSINVLETLDELGRLIEAELARWGTT